MVSGIGAPVASGALTSSGVTTGALSGVVLGVAVGTPEFSLGPHRTIHLAGNAGAGYAARPTEAETFNDTSNLHPSAIHVFEMLDKLSLLRPNGPRASGLRRSIKRASAGRARLRQGIAVLG